MKNGNDSMGKWISIIHRNLQIYTFRELQPYNIGKGQFIFLMALMKKDEISQEELSHILNIDKGTTARALRKLEIEGYIERKQDPHDKRAYKVYVTEKGRQIKPVLYELRKNLTDILSSDLSIEEKEMVLKLLERMAENISSFNNDNHK